MYIFERPAISGSSRFNPQVVHTCGGRSQYEIRFLWTLLSPNGKYPMVKTASMILIEKVK